MKSLVHTKYGSVISASDSNIGYDDISDKRTTNMNTK